MSEDNDGAEVRLDQTEGHDNPRIAQKSLLRLIGQALDATGDCRAYENDAFLEWLEQEARGRMTPAERRENEQVAQEIAKRAHARIRGLRAGAALAMRPLTACDAPIIGNVKQVANAAAASGCAPWVESLAVAAGLGREIWDEPCERWVRLPAGIDPGEYVALTVAGDSMTPYLKPNDVILVNPHARVARDCTVVARRADDGYVVKHVARCGRTELELSSFNPEYKPFTIVREPGAILGVVLARLVATGETS